MLGGEVRQAAFKMCVASACHSGSCLSGLALLLCLPVVASHYGLLSRQPTICLHAVCTMQECSRQTAVALHQFELR